MNHPNLDTIIIGALIGLAAYFIKRSISSIDSKFLKIEQDIRESYLLQTEIKSIEKEITLLSRNLETAFKRIDQINEKLYNQKRD